VLKVATSVNRTVGIRLRGEAGHSLEGAPGVQTRTAIDHIGDGTLKDNRAGLATLTTKKLAN
jgi:hypothetical protein